MRDEATMGDSQTEELGKLVRDLRERVVECSQRDFAEAVGLSMNTLHLAEIGARRLSDDAIERILEVVNIEVTASVVRLLCDTRPNQAIQRLRKMARKLWDEQIDSILASRRN